MADLTLRDRWLHAASEAAVVNMEIDKIVVNYGEIADAAVRVVLEHLRERLYPYNVDDGDGGVIRTRRNPTVEIDALLNELLHVEHTEADDAA